MNVLTLKREDAVGTWARSGIKDFFIAFHIENKFPRYSTFFCYQGLEKNCKAYLLGTKAAEYENLPRQQAKEKIDKIVRDRKTMGHGLKKMINDLISHSVLAREILTKEYGDLSYGGGNKITGLKCMEILEKAYIECRYPVPGPISKSYLLPKYKNIFWEPLGSSEPEKFAYEVGLTVIEKIGNDFNMAIPRDKFSSSIDDEDWIRFRRIFFKEDI